MIYLSIIHLIFTDHEGTQQSYTQPQSSSLSHSSPAGAVPTPRNISAMEASSSNENLQANKASVFISHRPQTLTHAQVETSTSALGLQPSGFTENHSHDRY